MREITISDGYESWSMRFEGTTVKDSEALHNLLCRVDPGDNYTVTFKNVD